MIGANFSVCSLNAFFGFFFQRAQHPDRPEDHLEDFLQQPDPLDTVRMFRLEARHVVSEGFGDAGQFEHRLPERVQLERVEILVQDELGQGDDFGECGQVVGAEGFVGALEQVALEEVVPLEEVEFEEFEYEYGEGVGAADVELV